MKSMKSKMRTWNVAMGSLSLLFLCVSPALAIATNPSQENPYTEQNDDSVTQQRTRKVTGVVRASGPADGLNRFDSS